MSKTANWLPSDRKNQIIMAKNWLSILNEEIEGKEGGRVKKYAVWGIPEAAVTELRLFLGEAEACLAAAENEETRTRPVNAACAAAFANLVGAMRDLKRRHFFIPPLTDADYAALGFRQPDRTRTVSGEPSAQVVADIYLTTGRHELGVRARYVKGSPEEKANKGYLYWYKVMAPGETPPANPDELTKLFSTLRQRDVIEFEFNDSGKTAYIAARVDNNGKKGPWGPMTSSVIP